MDRTPLTVFAPIDRSLHDLLAKSKSRSINLIELAKHHIGKSSLLLLPPPPPSETSVCLCSRPISISALNWKYFSSSVAGRLSVVVCRRCRPPVWVGCIQAEKVLLRELKLEPVARLRQRRRRRRPANLHNKLPTNIGDDLWKLATCLPPQSVAGKTC